MIDPKAAGELADRLEKRCQSPATTLSARHIVVHVDEVHTILAALRAAAVQTEHSILCNTRTFAKDRTCNCGAAEAIESSRSGGEGNMNPIVIDPPGFDQAAAWNECRGYVDKCGGLQHEDGEVNWRAAFGADPGCCSCPACGEMYWAWGRRQRCVKCAFEYPTDWWSMYSWGAQAGWRKTQGYQPIAFNSDRYMKHPYYRYGFEHPVEDPWKQTQTQAWRDEIRQAFTPTKAGEGDI